MASGRLSLLLALEIAPTGRAAADRDGPACANPADEHREPALGCAAHPRRTPQARVYMVKRRGPPSQGWRTFLRNHAPDIAAMDLFRSPVEFGRRQDRERTAPGRSWSWPLVQYIGVQMDSSIKEEQLRPTIGPPSCRKTMHLNKTDGRFFAAF